MIITVSELNDNLGKIIKSNANKSIILTGEITNLKTRGNHTYFCLKDESCSINICFFNDRLENKDGDKVNITGKVNYYGKTSSLNFIGRKIENIGRGNIKIEYEKLFKKYSEKGYFDRKKELPNEINNIGIITAYDGAARKDFLSVLERNSYVGNCYFYDCKVQGPNCPKTVCDGIQFFNSPFLNKHDENILVDLIIVMRGGGSEDDLMGFSHKSVVEELYKSKIYTMSAIGHEVDNMLSDYVCNNRAATPSIAGELISNSSGNLIKEISKTEQKIEIKIKDFTNELYKIKNSLLNMKEKLKNPQKEMLNKLNDYEKRIKKIITHKVYSCKNKIYNINNRIQSDNPKSMMKNNFMVLTTKKGEIIKDIQKYHNKKINIINQMGEFQIIIKLKDKIV
jgi:exodeoxyribonuclease VII large subunit